MRSIFSIYKLKSAGRSILPALAAYAAVSLFATAAYATGFGGEVATIGRIIQILAFSLGSLGIAWSAIEYAISSGSKADKAKSRMIYILFATAAVMLLPAVVRAAQAFFTQYAWSPDR